MSGITKIWNEILNINKKISWLNNKLECHIKKTSSSSTISTQIQSDWAQTDNTQVDYIKNKPSALGLDPASIPLFNTEQEAFDQLGANALFRYTEANLDGEPSLNNSRLAITRVT